MPIRRDSSTWVIPSARRRSRMRVPTMAFGTEAPPRRLEVDRLHAASRRCLTYFVMFHNGISMD